MPTDSILSALIHCALFTIDQIRYTFRLIVEVEADLGRSRRAITAVPGETQAHTLVSCRRAGILDRAMTSIQNANGTALTCASARNVSSFLSWSEPGVLHKNKEA